MGWGGDMEYCGQITTIICHSLNNSNVMVALAYLCKNAETQRDIHQRATDELADAGLEGLHLR